MNGTSSKIPTTPPLPLPRHFPPKGAAREPRLPGGGAVEQSETEGVPSDEWHQLKNTNYTPFAAAAALPPKGAAREPRLPGGGAVEQSETEGVWFVEWHQPKVTDDTPFAASRHKTEV